MATPPPPDIRATEPALAVSTLASAPSTTKEWFKALMLDDGYLAKLKGDMVKVYLAMLKLGGGRLNVDFATTHQTLMERSSVTEPTLQSAIKRLHQLGLVRVIREQQGVGSIYRCLMPNVERKERPEKRPSTKT